MEVTKPLDQDDHIRKSERLTPEKRLSDLYKYLAYKQRHPEDKEIRQDKENRRLRKNLTITSDESMNEYLEFLYGALLEPVAHHLEKMKPGDNLVLSPSEVQWHILQLGSSSNVHGVSKFDQRIPKMLEMGNLDLRA